MSDPLRVLLADDHAIMREGLRLLLEGEENFVVVGEAGDGETAVSLTGELRPQVVLLDLRMPGMDGLTALEVIRARWPEVAVVILTTYNEDELMIRGLQGGARGYLLKDTSRHALFATLLAAARGETLLQSDVLERAFSRATGKAAPRPAPVDTQTLTDREREVLAGVARGERSKEIALKLGIRERTVKAYLAKIYTKLGVDSRAAAIAVAARNGWLPGKL
jgi:NarL family two-component system response regulator YdfI